MQTYKEPTKIFKFYSYSYLELSPSLLLTASMPNPTRSYNHATSAAALFFKNTVGNTVHQALRVEVPEIGKEFTDSAYIGKGPFSFT